MPGPLTVVTIRESHRRGFLAGPLTTLGHGLLELLMVIALGFGLSSLISEEIVMIVIGSVGGVVLLFIGVDMINEVRGGKVSLGGSSIDKETRYGPVLSGVVASITNPYWTIWWFTVGANYVLLSLKRGLIGVPIFYLGHVLADLSWLSLIAFGISQGRRAINERYYRGLILACGIFLIGLALWFIYSGISALRF